MVALGNFAAFVVRAQRDFNYIPRVRPIGVMILRFGDRRHPRHKAKRLSEIGEDKFFVQLTINFLPRFCHATTLRGYRKRQLVERGVASDSAVLADTQRRSLTCTSCGKFRRQSCTHVTTSVKTTA